VLVAIAERLNITQVLTLDQRHFRLFRPQHCDAFDILP
jgi:predicted nucleic acid-binding protein